MEINLKGKNALITGASGGIGRTIARTLSECGANVAVHYHSDKTSADTLVSELLSKGCKAKAYKADITDESQVFKMRDEMAEDFGLPDLIVANAVIQYQFKHLLEQDVKDYYSQFESCVMQMVYLAKAFIPHMQQKHYGRIVAINTECSIEALPTFSAYAAGKRGLDGIVRVLAKEVGPDNITVNQIAPGWVITDKERQSGICEADDYISKVPLRRRGCDQDIANAAAFLLSDLASFITGAFIPVAGGRVMPSI